MQALSLGSENKQSTGSILSVREIMLRVYEMKERYTREVNPAYNVWGHGSSWHYFIKVVFKYNVYISYVFTLFINKLIIL